MMKCTISSMAALITVQYHYGWGRHYAYLDPFDRIEAMKYNAIGQSFGNSTSARVSMQDLSLTFICDRCYGLDFWPNVLYYPHDTAIRNL